MWKNAASQIISWCDWKGLIQEIGSDAVGRARESTERDKLNCVCEMPWCTYSRDQTDDLVLTHERNDADLVSLLMLRSLRLWLKQE